MMIKYTFVCEICGEVGPKTNGSQKYHKGKCSREANLRASRERGRIKAEEIKAKRKAGLIATEPEREILRPVYVDGVHIGDDPPDRILGKLGLNKNAIRHICSVKGLYPNMQ
jgi:hypothetical protein